jgi:hypothetical protein
MGDLQDILAEEPPLIPAVTAFSLSPELVDLGIIDYSTTQGIKLYQLSAAQLQPRLFDMESVGIHSFLHALCSSMVGISFWRFLPTLLLLMIIR